MRSIFDCDVVIAAGGLGSRLGCGKPKCLLEVDGKPLVRYAIDDLVEAGFKRIIVCYDNDDFISETKRILSHISSIEYVKKRKLASSYEILGEAEPLLQSSRLIFCYGHAPRPTAHILRLLKIHSPLAATALAKSTRRQPTRFRSRYYLEPPFVLNLNIVKQYRQVSWNDLFSLVNFSVVLASGPPEFNYWNEFVEYREYIRSKYYGIDVN